MLRFQESRRWAGPMGGVFRDRRLRWLLGAFGLSTASGWAYAVALSVYAFAHGGAGEVGLLWIVLMVPAGLAAPFLAAVADSCRSVRVLALSLAARGVLMLVCGLAIETALPSLAVYALAIVASLLSRLAGPAQAATLPALACGSDRLAAANTLVSQIEGLATVAGPALAGLVLAASGPSGAVTFAGFGVLVASVLAARIPVAKSDPHRDPADARGFRQLAMGITVVAQMRALRVLLGLYTAQTMVAGTLNVFLVVIAVRLLGIGASGVGFLNAALGIGGALGGMALLGFARTHLAGSVRIGLLLWSVPLALVAVKPTPVLAFPLLALVGVGNTLLDVGTFTLLQQAAPRHALARVFGVVEGAAVVAVGLGALLAPALLAICGIRCSLILAGLVLALLTAFSWRGIEPPTRSAELVLSPAPG
jgi:hypothetical protein